MLEEADKVYVMWGYLNGIIFGSDYSEDVCSAFLSPFVLPPLCQWQLQSHASNKTESD